MGLGFGVWNRQVGYISWLVHSKEKRVRTGTGKAGSRDRDRAHLDAESQHGVLPAHGIPVGLGYDIVLLVCHYRAARSVRGGRVREGAHKDVPGEFVGYLNRLCEGV